MTCRFLAETSTSKLYIVYEGSLLVGDFIYHKQSRKTSFLKLAKFLTHRQEEDVHNFMKEITEKENSINNEKRKANNKHHKRVARQRKSKVG